MAIRNILSNLAFDQDNGNQWNELTDTYSGSAYIYGIATNKSVRIGGTGTHWSVAKYIEFEYDQDTWNLRVTASHPIVYGVDQYVASGTSFRFGTANAAGIVYSTAGTYDSMNIWVDDSSGSRSNNITIVSNIVSSSDLSLPLSADPTLWFYGNDSANNSKTGRLQYEGTADVFVIDSTGTPIALATSGYKVLINTKTSSGAYDLEVNGDVKADYYYGDGSNLTGLGGGGFSYYGKYYEAGTTAITTGQIVDIDTTDVSTSAFSLSGGVLTCATAGTYLIFYTATVIGDSNADCEYNFELRKNSTGITGSLGAMYVDGSGYGGSCSGYVIVTLAVNDDIDLYGTRITGSATFSTTAEGSSIMVLGL